MYIDMVCKHRDLLGKGLLQAGLSALSGMRPKALARLNQLAVKIESEQWIEPAALCCIRSTSWWTSCSSIAVSSSVSLEKNSTQESASDIAVAFVTLGSKYDAAIARFSAQGENLDAYLLSEISLGALGKLTRRVEAFVRRSAYHVGLHAGSPIFPGEAQLGLDVQEQMLALAKAERIGMTLTKSGMLVPVKSLSMLIGIGSNMLRRSQKAACEQCASAKKCRQDCRRRQHIDQSTPLA